MKFDYESPGGAKASIEVRSDNLARIGISPYSLWSIGSLEHLVDVVRKILGERSATHSYVVDDDVWVP